MTGWTIVGDPGSVTACNCTICSRYGVLWAYDYENGRIKINGSTFVYERVDKTPPNLEFHFCPKCASVICWRAIKPEPDGRRRLAINIRLASVDEVGHLLIDHFDGLVSFEDLPSDGRRVCDLWF
jgi:hypothetical protein